jgi:hypothetical protein
MEPKTVTVRAGADRPGLPKKPFLESRHFLAKNPKPWLKSLDSQEEKKANGRK